MIAEKNSVICDKLLPTKRINNSSLRAFLKNLYLTAIFLYICRVRAETLLLFIRKTVRWHKKKQN